MRIGIFTDVHFSDSSSILKKIGDKYSMRLENCVQSLNWAEQAFLENGCDIEVCLGDFFDKSSLNAEELTAFKDIQWNILPKYFLVGNHELLTSNASFNSAWALLKDKIHIIDNVNLLTIANANLLFIPYKKEEDRLSLTEYFQQFNMNKNNTKIVFSHNDIKGINYGMFTSQTGFDISDIENNCDIFLNGHLHNGTQICRNGFNIGNLTGQNFTEDAFRHLHNIFILDTETREFYSIENPHAFNFYKIEINNESDFDILNTIKDNAVLSIRCNEILIDKLNSKLYNLTSKIAVKRIIISKNAISNDAIENQELNKIKTDYLSKFIDFCKEQIDNDEVLISELNEVCK